MIITSRFTLTLQKILYEGGVHAFFFWTVSQESVQISMPVLTVRLEEKQTCWPLLVFPN